MHPQHTVNLVDLKGQQTTFWSAGNKPTQSLFALTSAEVMSHLKALYLVSDKVLAAASFFFESQIARNVTGFLMPMFEKGEILYFVDSSIETFSEHGFAKIQKSPNELTAYNDLEVVAAHGRVLDSFEYILRRPSLSLSDRIVDLWVNDVVSQDTGTLGAYLKSVTSSERQLVSLQNGLTNIAQSREKDFVWEYVSPILRTMQLSTGFLSLARRRLAQMYAVATSEYLGASLDRPEHASLSAYIRKNSKFDSALFLSCMELLGVRQQLDDLRASDIVILKGTEEFRRFREFYFSLVEAMSYQSEEIKTWLPIYRRSALQLPETGVTRNEFLHGFRLLCRSMTRKTKTYTKPLDQLIQVYELFGFLTIEDFIDKIISLSMKAKMTVIEYQFAPSAYDHLNKDIEVRLKQIALTDSESIRVGLVQIDFSLERIKERSDFGYVLADTSVNLTKRKIFSSLRLAQKEMVRIMCFPELCLLPQWVEEMRTKFNNMIIIGGSYYKDKFNVCPIIIDGKAYFTRKITPSPELEEDVARGRGMGRGKEILVFQTKSGRFAVLICIDFREQVHRILHHTDPSIRSVDFIINPCYNSDIQNFQEQANQNCQLANFPYILQVNVKAIKGRECGGTCIIGMDHNSALRRYEDEDFRPKNDSIRYKLFQANGEVILIANLDIRRKGVPIPATELKMKDVCRYIYQSDDWQNYL